MMISPVYLEIAVLVLGGAVLLFEAFAQRIEKRVVALVSVVGLLGIFLLTFRVNPAAASSTAFWTFYTADTLSLVFKRFMLLTTVFVLLMMIDYAPVVTRSMGGSARQTGLGEFFTIPIFTCAGLMYLVSAIDLVMIFVSLELVTISFYVLISLTRRNPITLEAGV
jgi:NADH-quinone oxidoreductase subunit N